ncbi:hypothetical protein N431DRAFT_500082 [Stipitochalara longipes BDJ]|nr:hypothetical protein N431DRAFT_500082 [Stipitochalara longipes BDJ]
MVGAKSVGCATCKRRKIKCDERFPVCANCERAKRHCPGPKARFIRFIGPGNEEHMRGDTVQITVLTRPPSCSRSESLAASLASRLNGIKEIGYQLQTLGKFFPHIVPRVGHNPALDAAVKCLLGAHKSFIARSKTSCNDDLRNYNHALSLIRKDLNQYQSRTPSETICAAMLLCRYEILKLDSAAYLTHAGGVAALVEACGPHRITSDFDFALFRSNYPSIISTSIFAGKECFLATPAWDAVRNKCDESKVECDPLLSAVLAAFATLPNLLISLRTRTSDPLFSPIYGARSFKERISKSTPIVEQDLKDRALLFESPAYMHSCMPTYYTFATMNIAFRFCLYWGMTIIANSILMLHGEKDSSWVEESQSAADNICKSIEYFRSLKPLGASSMFLILSSSYGVSNKEVREKLAEEYQDLLEEVQPQPPELCGAAMQLMFDTLTGAHFIGNK